MLSVASEILAPLCKEVIMEKRYWDVLHQAAPVVWGEIGMGTIHTWHGTPDVRVRGSEFICRIAAPQFEIIDEVVSSDDDAEKRSDGTTTTFEEKLRYKDANMLQAIGTCVVSSFTEKSLNPDLQALVPTILIDQSFVCAYTTAKRMFY